MAKYFPEAPTPNLPSYRYRKTILSLPKLRFFFIHRRHETGGEQIQSMTASTAVTTNAGPYAAVPAPTAVQHQLPQPTRAPVLAPQRPAAPQLQGIPGYASQIEGLSVSQTIVNDVIIDLQSKVINETQQQYYGDSSSGNYLGKKLAFLP